jgi:hypothetical protein
VNAALSMHTAQATVVIDGTRRTLAFPALIREGQRLAGIERDAEQTLLAQRVRLGSFLLQVRNELARQPGQLWTAYVHSLGLHLRTVQMTMRLAEKIGTVDGGVDGPKLHAAIASAGLPERPLGEVSLHTAQQALGLRHERHRRAGGQAGGESTKTNHGSFSRSGDPDTKTNDRSFSRLENPNTKTNDRSFSPDWMPGPLDGELSAVGVGGGGGGAGGRRRAWGPDVASRSRLTCLRPPSQARAAAHARRAV